jgi:hypothetical protein
MFPLSFPRPTLLGIQREARARGISLSPADVGKLLDLNGEFTQTFDAAATLGAGWWCYLQANMSEKVTEVASVTVPAGTDNIVVNGTFDADTNWTKGTGWTITGGKAVATSVTTGKLTATVPPMVVGKLYKAVIAVEITSGDFSLLGQGWTGATRTTSGTYTEYIFGVTNTALELRRPSSTLTGNFDNLVIASVYGDASITALVANARYRATFTVSDYTAGVHNVMVGTQILPAFSANGTYTQEFVATAAHTTVTLNTVTASTFAPITVGSIVISRIETPTITLDANSSELIDGLTTYPMYPGETRLVTCNGSAFESVVLSPFKALFLETGTFTKPPGYSEFSGYLWAGGGSGGLATVANNAAGGGGGGACAPFRIPAWQLAQSETVTIGAGGAARVTTAASGDVGGTSTFSNVSSYGGGGGRGTTSATDAYGGGGGGIFGAGVVGGDGANGGGGSPFAVADANNPGYGGGCGNGATFSVYGGAGGKGTNATNHFTIACSVFGGGGGAQSSNNTYLGRLGGGSRYGGYGGTARMATYNGGDGVGFGGGGAGCSGGTRSGAGASGAAIIMGVV